MASAAAANTLWGCTSSSCCSRASNLTCRSYPQPHVLQCLHGGPRSCSAACRTPAAAALQVSLLTSSRTVRLGPVFVWCWVVLAAAAALATAKLPQRHRRHGGNRLPLLRRYDMLMRSVELDYLIKLVLSACCPPCQLRRVQACLSTLVACLTLRAADQPGPICRWQTTPTIPEHITMCDVVSVGTVACYFTYPCRLQTGAAHHFHILVPFASVICCQHPVELLSFHSQLLM